MFLSGCLFRENASGHPEEELYTDTEVHAGLAVEEEIQSDEKSCCSHSGLGKRSSSQKVSHRSKLQILSPAVNHRSNFITCETSKFIFLYLLCFTSWLRAVGYREAMKNLWI